MEVEKGNADAVVMREHRKGNWTLEETLILIEAKKLDEQRRMLKSTPSNAHSTTTITSMIRPGGELRWKWIEDYCWKKGCFRTQNQCNDKWDNLMRDFKKVRDFQSRRKTKTRCPQDNNGDGHHDDDDMSYWKMDKIERKNHNLPSNMLPQIYEALAHVVEAKLGISDLPTMVVHPCTTATTPPPPLPPPPPPPAGGGDQLPLPTEGFSGKRRRSSEEIDASILVEAIKGYEEREEIRHKELYIMLQKKYKIEESRIEMERQGFNGLVDAINNLSTSILAFTSQR